MIRAVSFGIVYGSVRLFSILPLWFLNGVGWLFFILLNYGLHYREKIILNNLHNAFPEKSSREIIQIKTRFYRYFSRLVVENLKMFNLPLKKLENFIHIENPEVLENYYKRGVSVAVIAAHYGNWEWLLGLRKDVPHHSIGIFKSFNDKYFNRFFKSHRSEYGTELVNMREVPRILTRYSQNNRLTLTVYIADQSPVWEEIQYWTRFLNQLTPVYLGPEKLARKFRMAVVYFRVKVLKNNRYAVEAIPVCDNAAELEEMDITEKHLKLLEEDIRNQPEFWLWSHRRWKLTEKRRKQERAGVYRFEGQRRKK